MEESWNVIRSILRDPLSHV
jgi:DNA-directed RNA polymerase II subunit RPB2